VGSSGGHGTVGDWDCGGACSPSLYPSVAATRFARSNHGGPALLRGGCAGAGAGTGGGASSLAEGLGDWSTASGGMFITSAMNEALG